MSFLQVHGFLANPFKIHTLLFDKLHSKPLLQLGFSFIHQSLSYLGLGLAVASGIVMPYLSRAKKRIGSEIGSKALRSDGSCSMVCAYMSWILLAGVVLTAILGWWWIDSIAALALVYYVVKEGWEGVEEARGKEDACDCCHD